MFSAFKPGVSCVRDLVSPQGLVTPLDLQNGRLREASARAHFMQCFMQRFINVSVYEFARTSGTMIVYCPEHSEYDLSLISELIE